MSQIKITKTEELEEILQYLQTRWPLMDELEIVKMAISHFYQEQVSQSMRTFSDDDWQKVFSNASLLEGELEEENE